jgi:hypothetical protein
MVCLLSDQRLGAPGVDACNVKLCKPAFGAAAHRHATGKEDLYQADMAQHALVARLAGDADQSPRSRGLR